MIILTIKNFGTGFDTRNSENTKINYELNKEVDYEAYEVFPRITIRIYGFSSTKI